ncbi:uncharacterized protein BX664DRAFT_268515 [Halteromyces radiatus]|uniref:uncharacterized protein n=1 Tax=Halteromyces radiatus TaxID=101107 RepID=UPI0022207551|nr:uncharacterized protein BX664DRAFT_268515 [Halteromyces radiatus]KAI8081417.1 hypothetical protein BX664DRAFT_268515 [Halteromyces radiatus]
MPDFDSTLIESDDGPLLGRTPPMLSYFCVYNPSLCHSEENTKDQILYYTAKKVVPADVKMKQVGLAQALVNVTSAFSVSRSTENVHSQRNRMVFLQPEPGFWIHMCVELGILRRQIKDPKGKEKLVTEYLDTELNDRALSSILQIGYEQFKLLNGTMTSILYGDDDSNSKPNRQQTRTLMHAIEEFFSSWIWHWDFDRLDSMVFGAVFNGIPSQPIVRSNYLDIHHLDLSVQKQFNSLISHMLVLDHEGSLIYRSLSLQSLDVRSLRKYILKRVEAYKIQQDNISAKQKENESSTKKEKGTTTTLKALTKSLSQAHIFNYFSKTSSSTTTDTSLPVADTTTTVTSDALLSPPTDIPTAPSSPVTESFDQNTHHCQGVFLTGMVDSIVHDLNGDDINVTKEDIVRVYLNSYPIVEEDDTTKPDPDILSEYILIIYKDQSNLVWSFLLPSYEQDVDDLVRDIDFYHSLERFMLEQGMSQIVSAIWKNIEEGEKRT